MAMTLMDRSTYIGGSDIAAVFGIDPWRTAFDPWLRLTGDPAWQPAEETGAMRWGNLLEPLLAEEYTRQTGRRVERSITVGEPPFVGHLDGYAYEDGVRGVFEAKYSEAARHWEDGIPEWYQAQGYWYLHLTGAPWCDFAVLLPRGDFRVIRLAADPAVQAGIFAKVKRWYDDYVVTRTPPPVDTSDASRRWLAQVADSDESALEAGADLEAVVGRLVEVKAQRKALESTEELLTNEAKALIGEHQYAVGRGWKASYKRTKPFESVDWKLAGGEMVSMLQLAGLAESADDAVKRATTLVENRRPLVVRTT